MPKKVTFSNLRVEVEVGPRWLAAVFAELDSGEQAEFFNELSRLVEKWAPGHGVMQWARMGDDLTPRGRDLLNSMVLDSK